MSERHVLKSDGAWVELRDVHDLRARDRKKVAATMTSAIRITDFSEGTMDADTSQVMEAYQNGVPEAIAAVMISTWDIPYLPDAKIPSIDPEVLGELLLDDYDRLMELIEPARALLLPNSSTDPDDYDDPASPSEPVSV